MISSVSPTTTGSYLSKSVEPNNKPCDCGVCTECTAKTGIKPHDHKVESVSISSEGRLLLEKNKSGAVDSKKRNETTAASQNEHSEEETKQIEALKSRDREVRAHESAHLMAAGNLALGGPSFEFQDGPDGKQYAVGGEVQIDTSPVEGDPEATIRKAARIQAAANAPADPSSQDRRVASQAAAMAVRAQTELAEQKKEVQESEGNQSSDKMSPYGKKEESGTIIDLLV